MKKSLLFILAIFIATTASHAAEYTVNSASELKTAISKVIAGDVILINGGEYVFTQTLEIKDKSGTANSKITMMANPLSATRPRFNFSALSEASANRGISLQNCNYWLIKGTDVYKAGDNGMIIQSSNNNIIEFCSFSECSDTGLQLGSASANNLILNCDSYFNADLSIENADGFACKLDVGSGNIFRGCRAWQNLDDGWDGYLRGANNISTSYENCWSFSNGKLKSGTVSGGDGNGFKTGGSDTKDLKHNASYKNCIAADNVKKGFDHNSNRGEVTLYNCAAYLNGTNMGFGTGNPLAKLTIKNTVVLGNTGDGNADVKDVTNNSWNSNPAIAVKSTDFESVTIADLKAARKADGSLPDINFLRPKSTSALINRGVDVGLPYKGTAPDIGVFEFDPALPLRLLSFTADVQENLNSKIKLSWVTTNEVNTQDFEVFRKGDDGDLTKIHTETAINFAGINKYYFVDKSPIHGNNYYQLKQNDLDGKFTLSDIVVVKNGFQETKSVSVFPNPAQDWVNIIHPVSATKSLLKITNANGTLIATYPVMPFEEKSNINLVELGPGLYTLAYVTEGNVITVKLIKI